MPIPNDDYFIELLSSSWQLLESDDLTALDLQIVDNCFKRLKKGLQMHIPPNVSLKDGLRQVFKNRDSDGSGQIDIEELNSLCNFLGVPLERK